MQIVEEVDMGSRRHEGPVNMGMLKALECISGDGSVESGRWGMRDTYMVCPLGD